jgi:hemoglobin
MNIHRQLHGKQPLEAEDFQRWLALFNATLDERFSGEQTERARRIAAAIAGNMESSLSSGR